MQTAVLAHLNQNKLIFRISPKQVKISSTILWHVYTLIRINIRIAVFAAVCNPCPGLRPLERRGVIFGNMKQCQTQVHFPWVGQEL